MTKDKRVAPLKYKKKGFTLIEILIVMAIMGIILSGLFSMNVFGIKVFNKSESRSNNQYEVRMAADLITKQLRYAKTLEIKNTIPTATSGNYDIYLNSISGKTQILYNKNGFSASAPGVSGVNDFTLTFTKVSNNIIKFKVGKSGTTSYDIESEVTLLNIPSADATKLVGSSGTTVTYTLDENFTPAQRVSMDKDWLTIFNPESITGNITLPASGPNGSTISWSSSNTSIITNSGVVTRPSSDVKVTLTATITNGGITGTKQIELTVKASASIVSVANISETVLQNQAYTMPTTVIATMSDNSTSNAAVSWNPATISTSTTGEKTSYGTVAGYGNQVILKLNVISSVNISIDNIFTTTTVKKNKYFSFAFNPKGGTAPYTFSYTNLPSWLAVNSKNSAVISGTAPKVDYASYPFTVTVRDSSNNSVSYNVIINVTTNGN